MLDPVQLPILMKAVDFVFDEGRKILDERRERRKRESPPAETENPGLVKEAQPLMLERAGVVKQDLLTSKIEETPWQNNEAEIQHLVRLLETYSRNYHIASEQYAKWGSELVPPIIVHRMTDAENSVLETINRLEIVLAKVYKKETSPGE
jgi:hypothetical protein